MNNDMISMLKVGDRIVSKNHNDLKYMQRILADNGIITRKVCKIMQLEVKEIKRDRRDQKDNS